MPKARIKRFECVTPVALAIVAGLILTLGSQRITAAPPPSAPSFEVASIKPSAMQFGSWFRFLPGGRFSATSWIKQVIQVAYGVEDYQVTGGPGWLTTDRYDIEANAASADAGKSEMAPMLQALLADRFKLQFHKETREFPIYHLVADKNGPRLTPWKPGDPEHCTKNNTFVCGLHTTAALVSSLKYMVGRPVFDQTGQDGKTFEILLDFDTETTMGRTPPPDWNKPSLSAALREQLGLRLEPDKASFPVYVVDSIQRPTEN